MVDASRLCHDLPSDIQSNIMLHNEDEEVWLCGVK